MLREDYREHHTPARQQAWWVDPLCAFAVGCMLAGFLMAGLV